MNIELKRLNKAVHFEATNEDGNSIIMDGSPAIGGENLGVRPMQTLMMGLAGCASIDVVVILKKMRQQLDDLKVNVEAETAKENDVTVFKNIILHFTLWGEIKEEKAKKAIEMSINTYCSVGKVIEKSAPISYTLSLNPG